MGVLLYIFLFFFLQSFVTGSDAAANPEPITSPSTTPQFVSILPTEAPTAHPSPSPEPTTIKQTPTATPVISTSKKVAPLSSPTPTPTIAGVSTSTIQEIISLTNSERQKRGLSLLKEDARLNDIAKRRATDLAQSGAFGHFGSDGTEQGFTLIKQAGIKYMTAGENLGEGYASAASLLAAWMTSSTHKANIINPEFTAIGVGQVTVGSKTVVVQLFIGS